MMGRSLLIVGALATVGLLVTAVLGYQLAEPFDIGSVSNHLIAAVITSLLLLFSHCWILFYLIGTGKALKDAVAEHGLESEIVERTKDFKRRSSGLLTLAMLLAMATFVVGGGVATAAIESWVHHTLFLLAAAVQVWALWVEAQVLTENERLLRSVDSRLKRRAGEEG